jgi:hypothetical protein
LCTRPPIERATHRRTPIDRSGSGRA